MFIKIVKDKNNFVRDGSKFLLFVFLFFIVAICPYSGNTLQAKNYSFDYINKQDNHNVGNWLCLNNKALNAGQNLFKMDIGNDSTQPDNKILPVEKPWRAINLAFDASVYNCSTTMDWLWEGHPGSYPNIFHTAKGSTMPHTFTFDFGRIYTNLVQMEQWGRWDPKGRSFANPIYFEVWGIDDITNAVPVVPSDDPNWARASIKKGWTLLAEVRRKDDGVKGMKINLIKNPPPVRFIRIRIKDTKNHNTQGLSHMSELSFWYADSESSN